MRFLVSMLVTAALWAQSAVLKAPDWVSVEANVKYSSHAETVLDVYQSKNAPACSRARLPSIR